MFEVIEENSAKTGGAQTGEAGAVPGDGGSPGAVSGVDAEARAKRDANAERQRARRAEKAADKAERDRKRADKKAKRAAAAGEAPKADAPSAPAAAVKPPEGWPAPEAQALQMPAAIALLSQVKFGLSAVPPLARYGAVLEVTTVQQMMPNGKTRTVTADPIADMLAPPLAAVLAQSGANMTPGQMLVSGLAMLFIPAALAHGTEALMAWHERRQGATREREVKPTSAPVVKAVAKPAAAVGAA